jgi:hypothetical protein
MIPWEGWTPIGQHSDKLTVCEIVLDEVFRHIGKSKSIQRRVQSQRAVVKYELPLHAHV